MDHVKELRSKMKEKGIDCYIVPTADYHGSEYVSGYFMSRKYVSGFTGSAGTLVVTGSESALFTDGRYFLQAEDQLKGTEIILMKMGEEGVPTIAEYLRANLTAGQVLGFDGQSMMLGEAKSYEGPWDIKCDVDLVGEIWEDRPDMPKDPAWLLSDELSGKSAEAKLADLRADIRALGADILVLTGLDDVAWLFNFRGNDVECTPEVLSFAVISADRADLFVDTSKFTPEDKLALEGIGVSFNEYTDFAAAVTEIRGKVLLDRAKVSYYIASTLEENCEVIYHENPTTLPKAIKNETEIRNVRAAHVRDGAALTKVLYRLKTGQFEDGTTEIDVMNMIEEERGKDQTYLGPSFTTIAGYAEHGAIIHYMATPETDKELKKENLLLIDTGGQYKGGTTDVTRTIALGHVSDEAKRDYTAVLKGHLALANAVFPKGTRGTNLDILAREPIFKIGKNFNHGTGHGVGYMLACHEGPQAFRQAVIGANDIIRPGMITSDEPGIYEAGKYGIRTETLLLAEERESGMLGFETLTLLPYDLDVVDFSMLDAIEREEINEYHSRVFAELSPLLEEDEKEWLKEATRSI